MASILKAAYRSIIPQRARRWVDYARSPAVRAMDEQVRFYNSERRRLFRTILRFCHVNRPASGYYMEFGCHSATTMRMAWHYFKQFDLKYLAFDSFEGLPEIGAIDKQEIWRKGNLATAEEEFTNVVTRAGMPRDRLRTIKGFYDQSLTPDLAAQLLPTKAAVVYVDCDLYESAVPALRFSRDFLKVGTVVVFDDWDCFLADPSRGERRAWAEFLAANPDLRFEEIGRISMSIAFACVSA
jgi:O-methyltransferase